MRYIECPANYYMEFADPVIFLAGGITDCPNWQADVVGELITIPDIVVANPRRDHFPINDLSAAKEQIAWEYKYLQMANIILFWFPCETLCPIVLYELGRWAHSDKPLLVGTHPQYKRRQDVIIQLGLARPDVRPISNSLKILTLRLKQHLGVCNDTG